MTRMGSKIRSLKKAVAPAVPPAGPQSVGDFDEVGRLRFALANMQQINAQLQGALGEANHRLLVVEAALQVAAPGVKWEHKDGKLVRTEAG